VVTVLLALLAAACSAGGAARSGPLANPASSVRAVPDYPGVCAPLGTDTSVTCLRVTLAAIDAARAREGLGPMRLPADFAQLPVAEQVFVAVDRERVDRGLAPFPGLSPALDAGAAKGARTSRLPPDPGRPYRSVDTEWIGDVDNGLDADYQWMYNDGLHAGVPGCTEQHSGGCWADRGIVLRRYGHDTLSMGAAFDATGDTSRGDRGGTSLTATLAVDDSGRGRRTGPFAYSWREALGATAAGTLSPLKAIPSSESNTGFADPRHNVAAVPDFTTVCAPGVDNSPACIAAALAAVNHAHALEGVRPMVLPGNFAALGMPEQLFVVTDLERVDRGLPPFVGLTAALDANAQRGADAADDPPDPGAGYELDDAEWAGGSSNGIDADYGWMYDDGFDSGNLDCERRGASGCWGHRKGILDDFGQSPNLVMGAALEPHGDTHEGDKGGTSMALSLAVARTAPTTYVFTWDQVRAQLPAGAVAGLP
jgi:hypothetical protein